MLGKKSRYQKLLKVKQAKYVMNVRETDRPKDEAKSREIKPKTKNKNNRQYHCVTTSTGSPTFNYQALTIIMTCCDWQHTHYSPKEVHTAYISIITNMAKTSENNNVQHHQSRRNYILETTIIIKN